MKKNNVVKNAEFYINLVRKLDSVTDTEDIYEKIYRVNLEAGIDSMKTKKNKSYYTGAIVTLKEIFGKVMVEEKDNNSNRMGRHKPSLFEFKVPTETLVEMIKDYFQTKTKSSEKIEKRVEVIATRRGIYRIRKNVMDSIYKVLLQVKKNYEEKKDNRLSFQEIARIAELQGFCENTHNRWKGYFHLDTQIVMNGSRKSIVFVDINKTIFEFKKKYQELYDINLSTTTKNKVENDENTAKPAKVIAIRQKQDKVEIDYRAVLYSTGGILNHQLGKSELVLNILVTLKHRFGIELKKEEFLDIIKRESEFKTYRSGGDLYIGFTSKLSSWDCISGKYSPEINKKTYLMRIGMSKSEIEKILEKEIDLVSKISDNDGIYSLTLSGEKKDIFKIVKLYRTFRGTDTIFDIKQKLELDKTIIEMDMHVEKTMLKYAIQD